jgi:hypothetical protein
MQSYLLHLYAVGHNLTIDLSVGKKKAHYEKIESNCEISSGNLCFYVLVSHSP